MVQVVFYTSDLVELKGPFLKVERRRVVVDPQRASVRVVIPESGSLVASYAGRDANRCVVTRAVFFAGFVRDGRCLRGAGLREACVVVYRGGRPVGWWDYRKVGHYTYSGSFAMSDSARGCSMISDT